MLYGGDDGSAISPMAGAGRLAAVMMGRRRRKRAPLGGTPGWHPGLSIDRGGPISALPADGVDPGFQMPPDHPAYQIDQGIELGGAGSLLKKRMLEGGPGMQPIAGGRVRWGGKIFTDPNKLWGWEQKHGNTGGREQFWRLHPDAARRLGMPVSGEQYDQANPLDPNELRAGLVGQLTQAQGALEGTPIAGVQRRAANMIGQRRRMHAVGAAQGRAQALAAVMARRLRGRQV